MKTVAEYVEGLEESRKEVIERLRAVVAANIPEGFEECFDYNMPGYSVPHSIYPAGYHCDPKIPLPFLGYASQKQHVGFYHMGIYANPELLNWFTTNYPLHSKRKLDMGKSCIRFKKMDDIPYDLIGELCRKMTVEDWIQLYESKLKR